MKEHLAVLKKDFLDSFSEIDLSKPYDPYSKLFMKPLFIGQMYMIAKCVIDDDVSEELEGAEKYMGMYISTNDGSYYDMAKDELHHAGILIKKHYEKADSKEKSELEEYELERQELLKRLEKIHKEVE